MADISSADLISNWSTLIENLEASPLSFFESVEAGVQKRAIPDVAISRIDYRESGILSAKREYLRITRDRLTFDMCAAPYGRGFFVSWWLSTPGISFNPFKTALLVGGCFVMMVILGIIIPIIGFFLAILLLPLVPVMIRWLASAGMLNDDFMLGIPLLGGLYKKYLRPDTYYTYDTASMFQTATHLSVLEVVDELTTAKGLRVLSESDRKPLMREFGKR